MCENAIELVENWLKGGAYKQNFSFSEMQKTFLLFY